MHVHVQAQSGEAKFWLEPDIELAVSFGLSAREIKEILNLVQVHQNEILSAWRRHFPV